MSASQFPRDDGYFMPAEYYPHEKTWLHWPWRKDNWRLNVVRAREAFTSVISAISRFEPVNVAVSSWCKDSAIEYIGSLPNVNIVDIDSDDAWMRDTGPTFVINGEGDVRGVNWIFNCWGEMGKIDGVNYMSYDTDDKVAGQIISHENVLGYRADFVLEGGSIHVDGEGTCITTEECLLNPNRNPNLSKEEIEEKLKAYLGVSKVIWLPNGLVADEDTNGHVDNFCAFVGPATVVLAWCDDESDPQYAISNEAYQILSNATDAKGRPLSIVKLPVPPVMHYTEEDCEGLEKRGEHAVREIGARMAASYVNFYIANGNSLYF
jgi:agmatine deiminase